MICEKKNQHVNVTWLNMPSSAKIMMDINACPVVGLLLQEVLNLDVVFLRRPIIYDRPTPPLPQSSAAI